MSNKPIVHNNGVQADAWEHLKGFTHARIALGNTGGSLPLKEVLAFQMAHAHAKDAVYAALDTKLLTSQLMEFNLPIFNALSKAKNREEYLKRPDLGRSPGDDSVAMLAKANPADIVFIIADGLSAQAVNSHAFAVLNQVMNHLTGAYTCAIVLVQQGRVAIGDEIGVLLGAKFTAVFIGERPGLSSAESMGIYTTYAPQKGLTDESRNCISNIHQGGLDYVQAGKLLHFLITQSFLRKLSGVSLKLENTIPLL